MRLLSRLSLVGAVCAVGLIGGGGPTVAALEETPPPAVEDYSYPGAAEILAERGIKLIRGDGHIVLLEDCPVGDRILVWSRVASTPFCFKAKGATGYLTLELEQAYFISAGSGHSLTAKVTVDGVTEPPITVPKDGGQGLGEGENPEKGPATLLEIRTTA